MDALQHLGFIPSRSPYNGGGLAYEFRGCELEAFPPDFTRRVAFVGSLEGTGRTTHVPLEFYFPEQLISIEQCAALLSYYLRRCPIQNPPSFLVEGRLCEDLLPWKIDAALRKAAYDALPKCFVQRKWLRLALNELITVITSKSDDTLIWLEFTSGLLSMRCDEERFVVVAKGIGWPELIVIRAGEIRDLPKRLFGIEIPVVVHHENVQIGTRYYSRLFNLNSVVLRKDIPSSADML